MNNQLLTVKLWSIIMNWTRVVIASDAGIIQWQIENSFT